MTSSTASPRCTCGGFRQGLHAIDCLTEAWTQPHAMANDHGDVFYPDGLEDARWFAATQGARPFRPDVFPFNLGGDP